MSRAKSGGPAFPGDRRAGMDDSGWWENGMTLRDYFAAKAMQGLIAMSPNFVTKAGEATGFNAGIDEHVRAVARGAYRIADAMLQMREEA